MRVVTWSVILAALIAALWLEGSGVCAEGGESGGAADGDALEHPAPQAMRVPCTTVISRLDSQVRLQKGRPADMSLVARQLGTSVLWVERCMLAYGRQPKRPGRESSEAREERLESLEGEEPEETGPEDVEEAGARERPVHPEKERQFRIKPAPTPRDFREERED